MAGIAQVTILMMLVAPLSAAADEIVLPSDSLDRTQPIELTYRMSEAATGEGISSSTDGSLFDKAHYHLQTRA
jgi:hypothetical protein